MSVKFDVTLSDEDAENLIDIIRDNECSLMDTHGDDAQREWCKLRLAYVRALKDKILKGQTRV